MAVNVRIPGTQVMLQMAKSPSTEIAFTAASLSRMTAVLGRMPFLTGGSRSGSFPPKPSAEPPSRPVDLTNKNHRATDGGERTASRHVSNGNIALRGHHIHGRPLSRMAPHPDGCPSRQAAADPAASPARCRRPEASRSAVRYSSIPVTV